MAKVIDLAGQKFNRLTVTNRVGKDLPVKWQCICDCGKIVVVNSQDIRTGHTISCGCYHKEMMKRCASSFTFKHGQSNNKLYRAWDAMVRRCKNPSDVNYKNYGGRGINVFPEWLSFIPFAEYMGQPPSKIYSIDRIDNNKGYEPGNVRWALVKEQCNNKRNNHRLEYNGETKTLTQWAEFLGLSRWTISSRLARGWNIEKALSFPIDIRCRGREYVQKS